MNQPTNSQADLKTYMRDWYDARKDRLSKPYDGVLGIPPSWMPGPLAQEFLCHRNELLDKGHTAEEIQEWRQAGANELKSYPRIRHWPPEYRCELDGLNYIQYIASLGEREGIDAYLGKLARAVYRGSVISDRQREIAKNFRYDRLARLIIDILEKEPELTWKQVLQRLENRDDGITVGDDVIKWKDSDGKVRKTRIIDLKDRVSRAKKKLSSR